MRKSSRKMALIAVGATLLVPAALTIEVQARMAADGVAPCAKNYSQNSVTGEYCPSSTTPARPPAAGGSSVCGKDYTKNAATGDYCEAIPSAGTGR